MGFERKDYTILNKKKGIAPGIIIILVGTALLIKNMGIIDPEIGRYIFTWELLLIVGGIIFMFSHENMGPGIVLVAIGSTLYLRYFYNFDFNFLQLFIPIFLIFLGITILFRKRPPCCKGRSMANGSNDDYIQEVAVFGGCTKNYNLQDFKGGKILAVFGGSTLDFRGSTLSPESKG